MNISANKPPKFDWKIFSESHDKHLLLNMTTQKTIFKDLQYFSDNYLMLGMDGGTIVVVDINNPCRIYARFSIH